MIIDKLSYQSNLRYVNACEKTVFAVVTLLLCVTGRSIAISVIVLAAMGFLTVEKRGNPFFRYVKLMTIPLAFLLMSTIAIILNWSRTPLDAFALPIGSHFLTSSPGVSVLWGTADSHSPGRSILPVFSLPLHSHAGYPDGT